MYRVAVIQLSGKTYFWALKKDEKEIASSSLIAKKSLIMIEAGEISILFNISIVVEERK